MLAGIAITSLVRKKRKRATFGALLSGSFALTTLILTAVGIESSRPGIRVSLPAVDMLAGSSLGYANGIKWQRALGSHGAIFSAADASRIEYPGLVPPEGTLEFWIKVNSGYRYSELQLRANQDDALIFSSDTQGGDVTWPGTSKFSVSRDGTLSYWMATSKYNEPAPHATEARGTRFRFGEWHALGVSYGSQGQYIMLDGRTVASAPQLKQTFGRAGNHTEPLDVPTIGETVSHFWPRHRVEGGFEGVVAAFRVSSNQRDWQLAYGIKLDPVSSGSKSTMNEENTTYASGGRRVIRPYPDREVESNKSGDAQDSDVEMHTGTDTTPSSNDKKLTAEFLQNAKQLFEDGEYAAALARCNSVLVKDPKNWEAKELRTRIEKTLEILNQ